MTHPRTPNFEKALVDLMMELFEPAELERFLRHRLPGGSEIADGVPWKDAKAHIVATYTRLQTARGTASLWPALVEIRPGQWKKIAEVWRMSGDPSPPDACDEPGIDAARRRLRRRSGWALGLSGFAALTAVWVVTRGTSDTPATTSVAPDLILAIDPHEILGADLRALVHAQLGDSAPVAGELAVVSSMPRELPEAGLVIDARTAEDSRIRFGDRLEWLTELPLSLDLSQAQGRRVALPVLYGLALAARGRPGEPICEDNTPREPQVLDALRAVLARVAGCGTPWTRAQLGSFRAQPGNAAWRTAVADFFAVAMGHEPPLHALDRAGPPWSRVRRMTAHLAATRSCQARPGTDELRTIRAIHDEIRTLEVPVCEAAAWDLIDWCLQIQAVGPAFTAPTCDAWDNCRACQEGPVIAQLYADAGVMFGRSGRWSDAAALFDQALQRDPDPILALAAAEAWLHAGDALEAQKRMAGLPRPARPSLALRWATLGWLVSRSPEAAQTVVEAGEECRRSRCAPLADAELRALVCRAEPCWFDALGAAPVSAETLFKATRI